MNQILNFCFVEICHCSPERCLKNSLFHLLYTWLKLPYVLTILNPSKSIILFHLGTKSIHTWFRTLKLTWGLCALSIWLTIFLYGAEHHLSPLTLDTDYSSGSFFNLSWDISFTLHSMNINEQGGCYVPVLSTNTVMLFFSPNKHSVIYKQSLFLFPSC